MLLALSSLTQPAFGFDLPALGFLPSVLALSLYAILPVLRNGVTGLTGVDPAIREAAKGVGMTPRQSLLRVEAPLAAPVVMAGIRTSAVWTIGAATLATPVGQTSLGNYIFTGLQIENWVFVAFGCVASAGLAIIVDRLLALIETGAERRDLRRIGAGLALLALGTGLAVAGGRSAARDISTGREKFQRAVHPRRSHGVADRTGGRDGGGARGARVGRCVSRARQRRDRRLCRLHRHALGECARPHRCAASRGNACATDGAAA